jgi:hypothetical protein
MTAVESWILVFVSAKVETTQVVARVLVEDLKKLKRTMI